ncbi:hypothetical protein ACB094_05G157700 [Castanea mollissima]
MGRIQGPLNAVPVVKSSPIESQWWMTESLTSLRHLVWRDSSGTPGREIDHDLITALVERCWQETYTFHMPHGSTQKEWDNVYDEFLGFRPVNDQRKQIHGQRILIQRLLEAVANPLLPNVTED